MFLMAAKVKILFISAIFTIFGANLAATAQETLPELVRRVKPSAVAVETFNAKGERIARGSGFFVASDKIVTNRHVIENASKVSVHLMNDKKLAVKGVLAIDGEGDLALLQVDALKESLAPLTVERTTPQEGESVVVIGNPFGLEGSVSNGIVSAVREIAGYGKIIQITAPISAGSSGSPVVNMRGQVIGVATLQAEEGQSLNFAVPAERILRLKTGALQTFAELSDETRTNRRKNAERLYSQGLALLSRDDYARAGVYFERAAQTDETYAEAFYQQGFALGMQAKHAEALKATRRAVALRPDWAEAYVNIGASAFALGQFRDALDAYRSAARLDASNADTQYAVGLTLNKLNRTDEEILAYKRAIALRPDFAAALEKLGAAYFRQKRYNEALAPFEQLKTLRGDAKSYNAYGETLFEIGKIAESLDAFNTALGLDAELDKARFNLARAYLKTESRDSAIAQYELLRAKNSAWTDRLYVLIYP